MFFSKNLVRFLIMLLFLILSFYLIKFSVPIIPIVMYTLLLYFSITRLNFFFTALFGFLFGFLYSFILFYISPIGFEVFIFFSVGIGIFYLLFSIISYFIVNSSFFKRKELYKISFFIMFLWFFKLVFFYLFLRSASFLLNAPPHFTFLFPYLGSSGTIAFLMFLTLLPYYFLSIRRVRIFVMTFLVSIFILTGLFFQGFLLEDQNSSHSLTLVQSSFYKNFDEGYFEDSELTSTYFLEIIDSSSTEIVILPETSYITYTNNQSLYYKDKFTKSSEDKLLVYGALEYNETHTKNIAYVFENQTLLGEHISSKPYENPNENKTYLKNEKPTIFNSSYGKFVVLICFEALHRSVLEDINVDELDFIIVISNNYFTESNEGLNTLIWNIQDLAGTNNVPIYSVSNNGPTFYTNRFGGIVNKTKNLGSEILIV